MQTHVKKQVFDALLAYIHDQLGFRFNASNREKLELKLRNIRLPEQWPDLEGFLQGLKAGDALAQDLLVRAITVNHTFFFREKPQIDYMLSVTKELKIQNPLIWSAASSTGEEAYSLALTLLSNGYRQFRIVASDVNAKVLRHMHQGLYHESRLENLSHAFLRTYFDKASEGYWHIKSYIRQYVAIKKVNLLSNLTFSNKYDFIFCRNVFIYFDEHSRNAALTTLRHNLKVGGYLFLGLTEALLEPPPGFAMVAHATYRRIA